MKLYREEKRSASSLANEYGVTVSTITKWIHQYQEVSLPNEKDTLMITAQLKLFISKCEFVYQTRFNSYEDLLLQTEKYIQQYNTERIRI